MVYFHTSLWNTQRLYFISRKPNVNRVEIR
jgi:hypothetical protein